MEYSPISPKYSKPKAMFCGNVWWRPILGSRQVTSLLRSFSHCSGVRAVVARNIPACTTLRSGIANI
eukprot:10121126-Ditylum_brightwellii.AAC.1